MRELLYEKLDSFELPQALGAFSQLFLFFFSKIRVSDIGMRYFEYTRPQVRAAFYHYALSIPNFSLMRPLIIRIVIKSLSRRISRKTSLCASSRRRSFVEPNLFRQHLGTLLLVDKYTHKKEQQRRQIFPGLYCETDLRVSCAEATTLEDISKLLTGVVNETFVSLTFSSCS